MNMIPKWAALSVAFLFALFLPGCGLFEAAQQAAAEPETAAKIADLTTEVLSSAESGDWSTTEKVGTATGVTLALTTLGIWLKQRMANSGPGEIIGGKAAKS